MPDTDGKSVNAVTVRELLEAIEKLWPMSGASSWDTPGLQVGSRRAEVTRVLLAVDLTPGVIDEAVGLDAQAIVTHHPLLLRGVTAVDGENDRGLLVQRLLAGSLTHIAAHTNANVVRDGVSDLLAQALQLSDIEPIEPVGMPGEGVGRVGTLPAPIRLEHFVDALNAVVPRVPSGIRVSGPPDAMVSTVALCGGAGDSLLSHPSVLSADVFVTSDLRHHPALDASIRAHSGNGPWLVDVSHWASESLWLGEAAAALGVLMPSVRFQVSATSSDPWDFLVS